MWLSWRIIGATCLGVVVGLASHALIKDAALRAELTGALGTINTVFIRSIKMIVAPLVLSSLMAGIGRMGGEVTAARIAVRALLWFLAASCAAILIAFLVVTSFGPGVDLHLRVTTASAPRVVAMTASGFVTNLVPTSIFSALAENEILQIVVFAVIAGLVLHRVGDDATLILKLLDASTRLMLQMARVIVAFSPIAIFASVAVALAQQGGSIFAAYAAYLGEFYLCLGILWGAIILAGAAAMGRKRQWRLLIAIREPALLAFAATSMEVAYPTLLARLENAGVSNRIASFLLPLSYAFNLSGSLCYCVFATLFLAQAFDVKLSPFQITQLLLMILVASKGIANVPRSSILVVSSVLPYLGIPDSGLILILAIDYVLDMGRTATNLLGTAVAVTSVAKWERPSCELLVENT